MATARTWIALASLVLAFITPFTAAGAADEAPARPRLVAQLGHSQPISAMSVSPDGRLLATAGNDGWLILWDAATLKELRRFRDPKSENFFAQVLDVKFSADGRYVAAMVNSFMRNLFSSSEGEYYVWEVDSGRHVELGDPEFHKSVLAFSADGKWAVAGSSETGFLSDATGKVGILSLTGSAPARYCGEDVGDFTDIAVAPNNKWFIAAISDGTARIYSLADGKEHRVLPSAPAKEGAEPNVLTETERQWQPGPMMAVAILSKGAEVAIGNTAGCIGMFATASGKPRWITRVPASVERLSITPDGRHVIVRTRLMFHVLDAEGKQVQSLVRGADTYEARFSPDGRYVVAGGQHTAVRLWEATTGRPVQTFSGFRSEVSAVAMSPDGAQVSAYVLDGGLWTWDAATGKLLTKHTERSNDGAIGRREPSGSGGEGSSTYRYQQGHLSPSGKWLLFDDEPALLDVPNDRTTSLRAMFGTMTHQVLALSADGAFLLAEVHNQDYQVADDGSTRQGIELWSTRSRKRVSRLPMNADEFVSDADISSDNTWLLTGSDSGEVCLWGAANGKLYRRFEGSGAVNCVRFSADSRLVAAAAMDGTARVWDRESGRLVGRIAGNKQPMDSLDFSPDGKALLAATADAARVWNIASGTEMRSFRLADGAVSHLEIAGDGRMLALGTDGILRVHPTPTDAKGTKVQSPPAERVTAWSYSRGRNECFFATSAAPTVDDLLEAELSMIGLSHVPTTISRWRFETGKTEATVRSPLAAGVATARLAKGTWPLVTGHLGGEAFRWARNVDHARITARDTPALPTALSPDGQRAIVLTDLQHWEPEMRDVGTGARRFALPSALSQMNSMDVGTLQELWKFSRDGGRILFASGDDLEALTVMDAASGRVIQRLPGHAGAINAFCFSPDDKAIATASNDGTARIWNTATGRAERVLKHPQPVLAVDYWPTGGWVVTGCNDGNIRVWHIASGKESKRIKVELPGEQAPPRPVGDELPAGVVEEDTGVTVRQVKVSPDRSCLFTIAKAGYQETSQLWDWNTGRRRGVLRTSADESSNAVLDSFMFSPDGQQLLGWGMLEDSVYVWSTRDGKLLYQLPGHSPSPSAAMFSADGKFVITCTTEGRIRFWDGRSGAELCTVFGFHTGDWAVVDPEGRYDGTNGGEIEGLHWVIGNEPIELVQLKARYHEPGLLGKKLGLNPEPLRDVTAFREPKLHPEVELDGSADDGTLTVHLTNRGGGLGAVVVKVNGKEVTADARGGRIDTDAATATLRVALADDPRVLPGARNTVEVVAFNAEGYLSSRGLKIMYNAPGRAAEVQPQLWGIIVGVSDYQGDAIDLRFAAKDAEDFAKALAISGGRLFGPDRTHITLLSAPAASADMPPPGPMPALPRPTRKKIEEAFQEAQKAGAEDILVVYLAGHGVNYGGQEGDFYFLTSEAQSAELTDPDVRRQAAISSDDLTQWLKSMRVPRQVLVLDTCASGRLAEKLSEKRDIPSSQHRALERVKDRTGMHVLAGCSADRVSYEATRYAQGLLTHSLLVGMRGAALRDEEFVDVSRLFDFASEEVPRIAQDIGGIQRPVIARPAGSSSFDIGRLTTDDRSRIPIQHVRPMVWRSAFQDEKLLFDRLQLGRQVNEVFREASAAGRDARLVFVDADGYPGACMVGGAYRETDGRVAVTVVMVQNNQELARFTVAGESASLEKLAAEIVLQATLRIAKPLPSGS